MSLLHVYWRALGYLAAYRARVALICGANVMLAVVVIAEPILFGEIIDAIADRRAFIPVLGLWAGLGVFSIVAYVLVARGADRLAHATRAKVLADSFEKVLTMPLSWHQKRGTSNSLHMLLRAVETLFNLWLEFMRQHLATAVALLLLIPTAISLDVRMSLVLMGLGTAYVLINRLVMKRTQEGQRQVERHYHTVFGHVTDSVNNVAVMQGYGRIVEETQRLRRFAHDLVSAQYPVLDWWALAAAMQRLASTASMLIVLVIGALLVSRGELRIGELIAFTGFANLLIGRLDQVTGFVLQVFDARARLEEFYELEDSVADRAEPPGLTELGRIKGDVVFDNVAFRFPGSSAGVENISFSVPAGQTVAIVGATGAGKTTLVNLLQRVYDPQDGRILVDGFDTRGVTRSSLRKQIATVFQDAGLLNRSIEENIRIGRESACYDDIHQAARAAAAHDFILSKTSGYDTQAGERGSQLSGGERQRIAIARALLKDAPILVLDEATSALDVETERQVKEALDRLRAGRTTFVIAHRLTTVRDADMVIVMDEGRIVEQGGFDELSRRNGRFAALLRAGGLLVEENGRPHLRLASSNEAA
ncbi:MAG: glucan ABC transporter ATP-binding protein/ permease [Rhizobiaceae bacterium]